MYKYKKVHFSAVMSPVTTWNMLCHQLKTKSITPWRKINPYSQTHTKNHTEDTAGSPMQSGIQALSSCPPLHFPPAPSTLKVNHTWLLSLVNVITFVNTNINLNWMTEQLQGNTRKYTGEETVTPNLRVMQRKLIHGTSFHALSTVVVLVTPGCI